MKASGPALGVSGGAQPYDANLTEVATVDPGATGLALLATATAAEAQAVLALISPSPWHMLGSLDGVTPAWVLSPPAWASIRGKQHVIRTNTGASQHINDEDLIANSGSVSLQGDDYGQWQRQTTAASINALVGHYCISAGSSPFPRPFSKKRGFCVTWEIRVSGTTNRRLVAGMQGSTASSAGLASISAAFQQSTVDGYFFVVASDGTSATKVYAYGDAQGVGFMTAIDTGITVAEGDVIVLAMYTLFGALGTAKNVGWEVQNVVSGTVARGDFSAGTPGVNEPGDASTFFPCDVLITLAATAIPHDTKRLAIWEP